MRLITACIIYVLVEASAAQRRPPNYSQDEMPRTSFSCRDKIVGGYYADPETDCQMFHVCVRVAGLGVQDFRFLCPNDTSFDQENQICDDWYNIDCEASTLYYSDNFDLYRIADGVPEFGPSRATPIPLGPSSIAPQPYNKPRRPLAPVNNAVSEDEDDSYLFKADTGDRRLHKDLLRGSSSGNFFANKNRGKEDNDYEDIASQDSTKNQLDTQSKKKQNKGVVRKLLTGKRIIQNQDVTTTTTTVAPNPYNNVGARNKYNTLQRSRPTTPVPVEQTANDYYQSTVAPVNNNYNARNNYNANAFNNYQTPTSTAIPPSVAYNNNFRSRGNGNYNSFASKQPETTVNYYSQPSTTVLPNQNYNNNYQYNNNYNTNQFQTSSTANPYNNNNYYQSTNGQTTKLQNYQQSSTTNGNNYYQQQQTQSTVNYYNQPYNNKSPTTDVYQQQSTTIKPFTGNNYYQQPSTTVKPFNNNYYQSTVTTTKPAVSNNYYTQQNYNNANNQQSTSTTFNYDLYYQTSTTNSPVNYPNYYTTQATPFVNNYDQGSSTTQNSNYQTKNIYNFNVNAANSAAAQASATNAAASFTNSQQPNYDPYNSYHNNNDKYDEPSYGESLKTAPSSNIKASDINSLSQQTYQAQKVQNSNNGFNTTVSASYNFNTEPQKIHPSSQKYQTTKSLQTTKSVQTTSKPNYYTVAVPTSKAVNRNTQIQPQHNYQNQYVSSSPSLLNRGNNNIYTTAAPSAAIIPESKKIVSPQQSTTVKSSSANVGSSKKEKDASYDYAYYDDGSPSEYDGFEPVGEDFSRTHSKKSKRGAMKQK